MLSVALAVLFYFVSWLLSALTTGELLSQSRVRNGKVQEEATALHPHTEKDSEQSSSALAAIRTESRAI